MLIRHTRLTRLVSAAAALATLLITAPAAAAQLAVGSTPTPTPGPGPAAAPALLKAEAFSPYLPQVSCDPAAKPGAEALRALLTDTYGKRTVYISRACAAGGRSEHKEGRALDWMLDARNPTDAAIAARFLSWLLKPGPDGVSAYNARRLGVMYVIWNRQVWNAYRAVDGWKPYTGASPHTDHIHLSLAWNGAMKQTSFWSGRVAPTDYGPCRRYLELPAPPYTSARLSRTCPPAIGVMTLSGSPLLKVGSTGPYVAQLQRRLNLTADGVFGAKTAAALAAFQTSVGLPATGSTEPATWSRLRAPKPARPSPSPTAKPARPSPSPTAKPARPSPAPTAPAHPAAGASSAVKVPVPVPAKPTVAPRGNASLAPYAALTLRQGARGQAVIALQKALHITADGVFGPKTAAAVRAFNTARRLPADGVVRPATWVALGAPPPGITGR